MAIRYFPEIDEDTAVTETSIRMQWETEQGDGYPWWNAETRRTVLYLAGGKNPPPVEVGNEVSSYVFSGLQPGTQYIATVAFEYYPIGGGGRMAVETDAVTRTTKGAAPAPEPVAQKPKISAPTLRMTPEKGRIRLDWTIPEEVDEFELNMSGGGWSWSGIVGGATRTASIPKTKEGATYTADLRGVVRYSLLGLVDVHVDRGPKATASVTVPKGLGWEAWRPWFPIHPKTKFDQGQRVAPLARVHDHVDLFTVGHDGAVWSCWWDGAHGWTPWLPIHGDARSDPKALVTPLSRRPDHVDLFLVGRDGAVWSSWWNDDAGWQRWFPIRPETRFPQRQPLAALARVPDHVDLFVVGDDGAVWSSWWNDDAGWQSWFPIHPETRFPPGAAVTAVARRPDHVDLFVVGSDGAVWSSWWHDDREGWRPWFPIHPAVKFRQGQEVAAVARVPEHMDLFMVGLDGAVWSTWWHDDGKGWRPWFPIHADARSDPRAVVTAVSRRPDHMDVFLVGGDGSVWSTWWHDDREAWRRWFPIHPATKFGQGGRVSPLARLPEHVDLFTVGFDGAVWSAWFDSTI